MCVVCAWCVWVCVCVVCRRAETERHSQAKDNVHGWISHIICLCFLSSFITSRIKTNPVTRESATTSPHLVFGQEDRGVFRVGGGGEGVTCSPQASLILTLCP